MTETEKFYQIYRESYFKYGKKWARDLGSYEKKRTEPFAKVNREVNSHMRRYLGGERFMKYIDTLEYTILKEGLLQKDSNGALDITLSTFTLWTE